MKYFIRAAVAACLAVFMCFFGYHVYERTVSGAVEIHEGVQIGELYISGKDSEKSTYNVTGNENKASEIPFSDVEIDDDAVAYADLASVDRDEKAEMHVTVSFDSEDFEDISEEPEDPLEDLYVDPGVKADGFFSQTRNFGDDIEIAWNPVRGAVGYEIYGLDLDRDGAVTEKHLIETSTDTKYIIGDIDAGKMSHIGVKPVIDDENVKSKMKKIDLCKPAEIASVKTSRVSDEKVNLRWDVSSGANLYRICYRKKSGFFEEIAQVEGNSLDVNIKKDKNYVFRVVPYYDNGFGCTRTSGSAMTAYKNVTGDIVSLDHQKYTSKECYDDIEILMMQYGDIMRTEVIGESEDGRDIVDICLGNEEADAALLIVCEIHAREYITTAMMMRIVEYYIKNYYGTIDDTKVCDLLKEICIHFVVMANPDGLEISQNETERWKANADGINVNANFPYNFKSYGDRSKGTYTGESAASSLEAQALVRITRDLSGKYERFGVVSYHAMGQIVFGSYKEEDEILESKIHDMYDVVRTSTGYKDAGYLDGGSAYGNFREYLIYVVGAPAVTVEVGATMCPCNVSDYENAFTKNKYVVLREAKAISAW